MRCRVQMPVWSLLLVLATCGLLIGGPNNIITSAVAADLSEHPSIKGNKRALGTVTGLINGSGSVVAAIGTAVSHPHHLRIGF
jgi:OPA family glycerol-3-phosphate transporter-like MFS transporter 1/2